MKSRSTSRPWLQFAAWVHQLKQEEGWSGAEVSRRLGAGVNQIQRWSQRGAPKYIWLASRHIDRQRRK